MSKYRYDIEQGTDEWHAIRSGKITASVASDLLMKTSTTGYKNLFKRIVEERITGVGAEGKWKGNSFTERGIKMEKEAVRSYEISNLVTIKRVGVVELDDWTLCSPDGLIDDNGLYQAKCPIFHTQVDYLKSQSVPSNYYKQMQFELLVTEREYNIFHSYHPLLPPFIKKLDRDEEMIKTIQEAIDRIKEEAVKEIELINDLILNS